MHQDRDKNWQDLCPAAATEQAPKKLMALVSEIIKALDERERKAESVRRNMKNYGVNTFVDSVRGRPTMAPALCL